jgi:HEAT repeat protein
MTKASADGMTAEEAGLARVMAAAGGPAFRDELARFRRLGVRACDLVLAVITGDLRPPTGVPQAHPRAVWEDAEEVIGAAAQRWPKRFVRGVAAHPLLRENFSVMWALGWVDLPAAGELLLDGVRIRKAGYGFTRWAALSSLVRLAHPGLTDELVRLVRDRHGMVRSTAVSAAIGYGDGRLIPELLRQAQAGRTAPGVRDDAWTPSRRSPSAKA